MDIDKFLFLYLNSFNNYLANFYLMKFNNFT